MLKAKLFLLAVGCILFLNTNAQIPNNNFENWEEINGYEFPVGWNVSVPDTFDPEGLKDDLAYSGSFALRLRREWDSYIVASCGFAMDYHPLVLHGWYHAKMLGPDDSMMVRVTLFNNGSPVDSGFWLYDGASSIPWSSLSISISNGFTECDSATISLWCIMHSPLDWEAFLCIDLLYFDDFIGISSPHSTDQLQLFPNPAVDKIVFTCPESTYTVTILNSLGVLIQQQSFSNCNHPTLDVGSLSSGIYLLQINTGNQRWISKFVKD